GLRLEGRYVGCQSHGVPAAGPGRAAWLFADAQPTALQSVMARRPEGDWRSRADHPGRSSRAAYIPPRLATEVGSFLRGRRFNFEDTIRSTRPVGIRDVVGQPVCRRDATGRPPIRLDPAATATMVNVVIAQH